jgi:hypothetical protein
MRKTLLMLLAVAAWPMAAGTIWMPRHIIAEATSPGGAIVSFSVSGEDANGRPLTNKITCTHASGAASSAAFGLANQPLISPDALVVELEFVAPQGGAGA